MGATWTMHEPLWQHGAAWVTSYGKGTTYGKGATNGNMANVAAHTKACVLGVLELAASDSQRRPLGPWHQR